jgi:antitoxin MazE
MEMPIVRIGNSKGIRLSKIILEKYEIKDSVEVIMEDDYIVLKPINQPRKGWDEAFKKMHESGDDKLLMDDTFDDENLDEWN